MQHGSSSSKSEEKRMLALRNTIANEDLELQQRLKAEAEAARIRRAAEKQAAEPARQQHLECDRAAAEEKRRVAATEKAARLQAAEAAAAAAKAKWQEELRRKLKPRLRRLRLLQRLRQKKNGGGQQLWEKFESQRRDAARDAERKI